MMTLGNPRRRAPLGALSLTLLWATTLMAVSECSSDEPVDFDMDGYLSDVDCQDGDPSIHPGADEICNKKDDDCNGLVDEVPDDDLDNYSTCWGDCNDQDPNVHPYASDTCDGVDTDCDGTIDEDVTVDRDGDKVPQCAGDCDDLDANVFPGQLEVCDAKDNNCDGRIDEDAVCGVPHDWDWDGITADLDCDDLDPYRFPGSDEWCADLKDNDCDGMVDESPCATDTSQIRYYDSQRLWTQELCEKPPCQYLFSFSFEAKVRSSAQNETVYVELTEGDWDAVTSLPLVYGSALGDNSLYEGTLELLYSEDPSSSAQLLYLYRFVRKIDNQYYVDDNGGLGYPLSTEGASIN